MSHSNEFWNFGNADRSEDAPKGYFTPLFPHNLGRPLHHPEQDYNAHLISQIVKGFRVIGSGTDGVMTTDDLELGIKLHEVNPTDADYLHYITCGCKDEEWIWIPSEMGGTATSPLTVGAIATDANICNNTLPSISAYGQGGAGQPYEYSLQASNAVNPGNITNWTPVGQFSTYNGSPLVVNTTYFVYVKDALNSFAISSAVTVGETVPHTVDLQVIQDVTQPNGNNGEIEATVSGGIGGYTYSLYQGNDPANPGPLVEQYGVTAQSVVTFPINHPISAGDYIIEVTDASTGCTGTDTITVSQPESLTFVPIIRNATCHDFNHGTDSFSADGFEFGNVTGGTAPYEYSITDPNTTGYTWVTGPIFDIGAGDLTIYPAVKDATGYIHETPGGVIFYNPEAYDFNVTGVAANCQTGLGSIIFSNLQGGPVVNHWPNVYWQFSVDGSNWLPSHPNAVTGPSFEYPASPGQYDNCAIRRVFEIEPGVWIEACPSFLKSATIDDADVVTLDHNIVDDVICGTSGSGEINISNILIGGQNASLNYSIEWSSEADPANWISDTSQTTDSYDITGLNAGTYNIIVTNTAVADGCTYIFTANIQDITSNIQLTIDDSMDPSCNGATDGYVDLSVSNGTAPYTYSYNTGGSEIILEANSQNNTWVDASGGFGGDSYVFTVVDGNGCSDSVSITLTDPAEVVASITIDNNNICNGQSGGQLTASATGGDGNYTYAWSNGETTPTINTLFAGTYSVVVTDGNGCASSSVSEDILEYAQINITLDSQTNVTCNGGSDGSANITVTGDGPFTYQWVDLADGITIVSTDQNPTGLSAGNYAVGVIGAGGCGGNPTWTLNITEPTAISHSTVTTDESIAGQNDGSATITTGGGTLEYSVSVNGNTINGTAGQTVFVFSNLAPGTYSYTITDGNGCTDPGNFTIASGNSNVNIDNLSQTDTPCHGGETTVSIAVEGGSTNYEFSEDGTNWIGAVTGATTPYTFTFPTSVGAGTYTYYVKDTVTNDQDDQEIIVIDHTIPSATATVTNETVTGADDGIIEVTNLTGGTGTYVSVELFDSNDNSVGIINAPGPYTFTNLPDGSYTIEIKDDNDCSGPVGTQVLPGGAQLSVSVAALDNPILCYGQTTDVTMTLTGGTGTFRFSNDNGVNWTNYITTNTYTWNNVSATDTSVWPIGVPYMVEDQDTSAPASQQTHYLIVTENTQVSPTPTTQNESIDGQNDGSVTIDVAGGVADYDVQINDANGNGQLINGTGGQTQFVFTGLAPGQYTILGADSNNCPISGQFTIAQGSPQVHIHDLSAGNILCHGGSTDIDMIVEGGSGDYQYSVSPSSSNTPGSYGSTTQITTESWTASAGTWWLFVRDAVTGDWDGQSVSISQPSPMNASFNGAESYPGANDASIDVFITGGTAPYSISCTETGETLTGLSSSSGPTPSGTFTSINSAGTYNFVITDANGCTHGPTTVIGTTYTNIAITNVIDDTVCYGETNGQIKIYPSGGSGNYEFSRNGGSSYSSANYSTYGYGLFLQVPPGNYDVWIRDTFTGEELEWSSNPVVVSEAQEIQVISETMTDGTCSTYPTYTMTFSGSNITQVLGNQQVRIKFTSPTIAQVGATVTATGTPNVYQAEYTSAQWQQLDNSISQYDFTSGTFNLEIESDGCTNSFGPVSYTTPDDIVLTASLVSEPECPGDGWTYDVTASGGTSNSYNLISTGSGSVTYLSGWDGTLQQITVDEDLNGVMAIMAQHTDYASNGCQSNVVVVNASIVTAMSVSGSVNNPNCASSGGSTYSFTISGGLPGGIANNTYKYKISINGGTSYAGTEYDYSGTVGPIGISDGDIYIKAYRIANGNSTEDSGCDVEEGIGLVTNPVAISGSIDGVSTTGPTACDGPNASDGQITMNVSGGTGVYEFSYNSGANWYTLTETSPGSGEYKFDGLTAGVYGIEVRDSNGCIAFTDTVTLVAPNSPVVQSHKIEGCWRDADGASVTTEVLVANNGSANSAGLYEFTDTNADAPTTNTTGVFTYSNSDMTTHVQTPITIKEISTQCSYVMNTFNFTAVPSLESNGVIGNFNNTPSGNPTGIYDTDDFKVWNIGNSGNVGYGGPYTVELIDWNGNVYGTINNATTGNNYIYDVPSGDYTYKIYDNYGVSGCGRTYTTPMTSTQQVLNEETFYHIHTGGGSVAPYGDLMSTTTTWWTSAGASTQDINVIMADMIDNGNGTTYPSGVTMPDVGTFEFAGPIAGNNCGQTWTHNASSGLNSYYLAVPNNSSFPERSCNSRKWKCRLFPIFNVMA